MRPEHWWYTAPLRLRSIFRRRRVESEMEEELRFHLEHKIEEGVAAGLTPEEARRRALLAMQGLDQRKEEIRDALRVHWLTDFVDDARYAIRTLRRTPGLAAFVVVTIALGVGMTATPFSMLDALLFRPYPIPRAGRLMTLVSTSRENAYGSFSYREYLDIRDHAKSYEAVIAHTVVRPVGYAPSVRETPRIRGGQLVSGNFFRALEVEPRLGRGFREDEDRVPGRDAVVVLGPDFWKSEFGADPSVVGRTIRLNARDFTIVGVLPESFTGLYIFDHPDFYVPLAMAKTFTTEAKKSFFEDWDDRELVVRGRLGPGVSLADARNELAALAKNFERDHPATNRDRSAAVHTMREMRTAGGPWKFGVVFTGLAFVVLLVACTNAAGLLLARARSRTREIAVRLAIGAGRSRLVRLLLTESLVLALLGGLGGVAIGYAGIAALQTFSIPAELPVRVPFRMDERVLLASLGFSLLSAIFCGLAPALQSARVDLVHGLKAAEGDDPSRSRRRLWGRNALVVAQIAMSLMLLAAAFVMYRGFHRSLREGLDFARDASNHVLMAKFDPRLVQYDDVRTKRFYELLIERLRQEPGVWSVGQTQNPPLGLEGFDLLSFVPEGLTMPRDLPTLTSRVDRVDEGFFEAMGVPIVRGRGLRPTDTADAPRVAVVNEFFAKHYWPKSDALGKRIRLDGPEGAPVEIVGVARTVKYGEGGEYQVDFVYLPVAQNPVPRRVLLLRRGAGDPLSLVPRVKEIVRSLDPNMPILRLMSYGELYSYAAVAGPGVAIKLVGILGTVALILALAGLYGLVAYNVGRRTREIGIRMAIGARPSDVRRLMMRKGLSLVAIGMVFGLALGLGVERVMNSMLFEAAGGTDLLVYAVVVPAMLAVTVLAAYVPARRAARIAPTLALRYE